MHVNGFLHHEQADDDIPMASANTLKHWMASRPAETIANRHAALATYRHVLRAINLSFRGSPVFQHSTND
jgi:hypothetical protein